jgi:tetratricopeptide (TPR) repeat protein
MSAEVERGLEHHAVRQLAGLVKAGMESHIQALESHDARLYEAVFTLQQARDHLVSIDYSTATGLADLKAGFEYGVSQVVWQLERSQETLVSIARTFEEPLDTQARELRKRAQQAYRNGMATSDETRRRWMEDALSDYLEAIQRNRYDFTLHFDVATIFWQEKGDLASAAVYYEEAARYAAPTSDYYASYALLHLGQVRRLQDDFGHAYSAAREAVRLSPDLAQASYDLALYCSLTRRYEECVEALRKAAEADELYWVRAAIDMDHGDLAPVREEILKLQQSLRDEQREIARKGLSDARCEIETARLALAETRSAPEFASAVGDYERSRQLFGENSRFSLLSAVSMVSQATAAARAARERAEAAERAGAAATAAIDATAEAIALARRSDAGRYCPGEIALSSDRLRSARRLHALGTLEGYQEARKEAQSGLEAAQRAARSAETAVRRQRAVAKRALRLILAGSVVFALGALGLVARQALAPRFHPRVFARGFGPRWSPDGRRIAYFRPATSGPRLRIDSLRAVRPLELPLGDSDPSDCRCEWSPDGRRIAVFDSQPGGWDSQETRLRVYSSSSGQLVLTVPRSGPYARLTKGEYRKLLVPKWLSTLAREDSPAAPSARAGSPRSAQDKAGRAEFTGAEMLLGPQREGWYFTQPSSRRQQRAGTKVVHVIGSDVYLREGRRDLRIGEGSGPRLSPDGSMAAFEREGSIYLVNLEG